MSKTALNTARWLVGLLFVFSGFIKANDPIGFGYKLQEYFEVFHLNFLSGGATGIAILLCALEMVLGAFLCLGLWPKQVMKWMLALILFFTFLTFVSAAFKVVTSCGCFGDAIPLTPWESFGKDVILLLLIVYLFRNRTRIETLLRPGTMQKGIAALIVLISLFFGLYTYNYLPVFDFLPYKVGSSIPDSMRIPEGAPVDEYLITYQLKNKKTGESRKMSDKEYMSQEVWKDENWEIIGEPDKKLIKKGYEAKIKDLLISDETGTDYTKEIVENPFYNLIIVAYNLADADENAIAKINALALNAVEQYNIRTVLLTSSNKQDAEAFSKKMKLFAEIFYADAVPLKSMVRSNPGILLMKNGVIINKWHYHRLPSFDKLSAAYFNK